jgi:drug/metabolite transporter (DMT)-like permease
MCLLAAVSYATAVVGQKPALRHASALQVTTFGCLIGTVATLPFAARLVSQTASAPVSATLMVVYLGVVPTALAFTTWAYALNRTTAGKMGVTTYIVPVLVVLMSWAFLGETPRPLAYLGGVLCLTGVAISRGRRPPVTVEPAAAEPVATEPITGGGPQGRRTRSPPGRQV